MNLDPYISNRTHDEVGRGHHVAAHRFSMKSMPIAVFLFAFVLAAFSRGSQLLGNGVGVFYAIVACLLVYLILRAIAHTPLQKTQLAVLAIFVLLISGAFAFPHYLTWDLAYVVERHAAERNAYRDLSRVLDSDPAFAKLAVSTSHRKATTVEIAGAINSEEDIEKLRARLTTECDFLRHCYVKWDIKVLSTGAHYSDDSPLFEEHSNP